MFVVEYSLKQQGYHVSTVKEMIQNNLKLLRRRESTGYVPVALTEKRDEAIELANKFESLIGRPKLLGDS